MIPAESIEPCLISQQCVLKPTKTTDIIVIYKNVSTLNVAEHGKIFAVQELHSLFGGKGGGGIKINNC